MSDVCFDFQLAEALAVPDKSKADFEKFTAAKVELEVSSLNRNTLHEAISDRIFSFRYFDTQKVCKSMSQFFLYL